MIATIEQSPALTAITRLRHGFFGRLGGHSTGAFAANNMSLTVGDDAQTVAANRHDAAATLGPDLQLCLSRQTHSSQIRVLTGQPDLDTMVEADAMVTNLTTLALGILTADCTPVLFADTQAGIIGAAHAGWRGAVDGIVGNTIAAMVALGAHPSRIVAAIGPTVTAPNYEVGDQFRADFLALHPGGERFFITPPGGIAHFDLPAFVREQLDQSGVTQVDRVGSCTYASPERYFSHRYATHQAIVTGRQIAIIAQL